MRVVLKSRRVGLLVRGIVRKKGKICLRVSEVLVD